LEALDGLGIPGWYGRRSHSHYSSGFILFFCVSHGRSGNSPLSEWQVTGNIKVHLFTRLTCYNKSRLTIFQFPIFIPGSLLPGIELPACPSRLLTYHLSDYHLLILSSEPIRADHHQIHLICPVLDTVRGILPLVVIIVIVTITTPLFANLLLLSFSKPPMFPLARSCDIGDIHAVQKDKDVAVESRFLRWAGSHI